MGEVSDVKPLKGFFQRDPQYPENAGGVIYSFVVTDLADASQIQVAAYGTYARKLNGKFHERHRYIFSGDRSCLVSRHPANPTNHPVEIRPDESFKFERVSSVKHEIPDLVFTSIKDIKNKKSGLVNVIGVIVGYAGVNNGRSGRKAKLKLIDETDTTIHLEINNPTFYGEALTANNVAVFKRVQIVNKKDEISLKFTSSSSLLRSSKFEMSGDLFSWFDETRRIFHSDSMEM
uniref:DUF223 domain-containing protein n=1 Tax=Strongyloides papillosus TaxID=174720 RepID=A0A0N5BJJ8_STREA